jgi:hypothetical protein
MSEGKMTPQTALEILRIAGETTANAISGHTGTQSSVVAKTYTEVFNAVHAAYLELQQRPETK